MKQVYELAVRSKETNTTIYSFYFKSYENALKQKEEFEKVNIVDDLFCAIYNIYFED